MTRNFKLWKPRVGDLRNAGLQLSRRQPRRKFSDDNFSVRLSFINEKLAFGVHLRHAKAEHADGGNNSKLFHGDVSGHRLTVPSFNSISKSGGDEKET
ncbi:MAG: hypothetical protein ACI8P0_000295 [Planctomycetaceae bacterium]